MNDLVKELKLNNHQRMILAAMRTGIKDARVGNDNDAQVYGARSDSAWGKWYDYGYQGLGLPSQLGGMGLEL